METRTDGRRRLHASFRATLARIADRIDREPYHTAKWTDRLVYCGRRMQCRFRVRSLWVAGSYARGASTCGDLGLIADVAVESAPHPGETAIARALVKGSPDLRLYVGTPEKNHSGMAFPEARLVWSETEPDWRTALAAIGEDPGASRFSRRGDALKFRSERLSDWVPQDGEKRSGLERLVDLRDNSVITWTFTDASTIDQDEATWRSDAREYSTWIEPFVGKKTHRAMKEAVGHLQREDARIDWTRRRRRHDGLHFTVDGIEIRIGRPSIGLTALETVDRSALVRRDFEDPDIALASSEAIVRGLKPSRMRA